MERILDTKLHLMRISVKLLIFAPKIIEHYRN